jgi:Domain of unknown function (DUF4279)
MSGMNKASSAPEGDRVSIGGAVIGSSASLRIFGSTLDPREITRLLGCSPSLGYRAGDPISPAVSAVRKQGMWLLESPLGREQSLSAHVSWIMTELTADPAVWKQIATQFTADLYCAIEVRSPNSGTELTHEVIEQVNRRNLSIQLDLYVDDDEET